MRVGLVIDSPAPACGARDGAEVWGIEVPGPRRRSGRRSFRPKRSSISFASNIPTCPSSIAVIGFSSRNGRGNGWWLVDWPDADEHFSTGVQRLTRVDTGDPLHMSLTDDRLFDNPWIYATQTGWWGSGQRRNCPLARVPAPRRIPDGGRLLGPRSRAMGNIQGNHAEGDAEQTYFGHRHGRFGDARSLRHSAKGPFVYSRAPATYAAGREEQW